MQRATLRKAWSMSRTAPGLKTSALITDMNEPLATAAGNAVEVMNAVAYLVGAHRDPRLDAVVIALAAEMLTLGGIADGTADGEARAYEALKSGRAAETFQKMVRMLGGPSDLVEHPARHLPKARIAKPATPSAEGAVAAIDTRGLGLAVVALGGGRRRAEDSIDHAVGLTELAGLGDEVGLDRPLAIVHAQDDDAADAAIESVRRAYRLGAPRARRLIYERVGTEKD